METQTVNWDHVAQGAEDTAYKLDGVGGDWAKNFFNAMRIILAAKPKATSLLDAGVMVEAPDFKPLGKEENDELLRKMALVFGPPVKHTVKRR